MEPIIGKNLQGIDWTQDFNLAPFLNVDGENIDDATPQSATTLFHTRSEFPSPSKSDHIVPSDLSPTYSETSDFFDDFPAAPTENVSDDLSFLESNLDTEESVSLPCNIAAPLNVLGEKNLNQINNSLQTSDYKSKRRSALQAERNLKDLALQWDEIKPLQKRSTARKVEKKKSLLSIPTTNKVSQESRFGEEKMAKMEKNRQSARDCRKRKKLYIQGLENRVQTLERELSLALDEIKILRDRLRNPKAD